MVVVVVVVVVVGVVVVVIKMLTKNSTCNNDNNSTCAYLGPPLRETCAMQVLDHGKNARIGPLLKTFLGFLDGSHIYRPTLGQSRPRIIQAPSRPGKKTKGLEAIDVSWRPTFPLSKVLKMLKVYQEPNDWTVSLGDLSTQKWHNNAQYKPLITTEQPASSDTTATQRANRTCNRGKPGLKCGFSDLPLTNIFAEIRGEN